MPKGDFIPRSDEKLLVWHDQFKTATENRATAFGLTQADLAQIATDNADLHDKVASAIAHAATAKEATQEKDDTRQVVVEHARTLTRRLKAHSAYTEAIGNDFGTEGPEQGAGGDVEQAQLSGTAKLHGVVELKFKKGHSDGVNIYSQRDGDAGFVFLARDTASPYVDNRPLLVANKPEARSYKAVNVIGDEETGLASDVVVVTAQP